jgi:hypothetical protein
MRFGGARRRFFAQNVGHRCVLRERLAFWWRAGFLLDSTLT